MKKLFFSTISIILIFGKVALFAQDYTPPENVKLEKPEDYAKYEPEVIKCIEYLEKVPLNDLDKRKDASQFFIKWIPGSPNVNIDILPYLMTLVKENKDFFVTFMGGWTKYALDSNDFKNKVNGHLAGLRAIIRVYKENKGAKSDDAVDELVAIEKDGKLEKWLQEKLEQK
jgi:hypothetical protein